MMLKVAEKRSSCIGVILRIAVANQGYLRLPTCREVRLRM